MHSYLRSIGFSDITKEKMDAIFYEMMRTPDSLEVALDSENSEFVEIRYEIARNIGIAMRGTYDDEDNFHMDYYFPYCIGSDFSTNAEVEIIKQSDRECYQGLCDDLRLGVNLVFFLQNMMEFLQKRDREKKYHIYTGARLSGLSTEGMILLPIKQSEKVASAARTNNERDHLMAAAREGDEEAIEHLTLEDMDTYSMISRRIGKEDILSIVTTYFMPYGIESDKYSILGNIMAYRRYYNHISMEEVVVLTVESNDLTFDVCINRKDLLGEPEVGRRFKGTVWMQGSVEIQS